MRRLLLLGGGHCHAAVLKRFGEEPVAGVELVLVNPGRYAAYSGMIPGLIAGDYEWRQCHIDLERLAGFAGARVLDDRAAGIDPDARRVALEGGAALEYAWLSIDVGSTPAAGDVPGVARNAVSVRPAERLLAALEGLSERSRRGTLGRVVVVGAGAAGIEVALSLQHRLRREGASPPAFVVATDAPHVLPGHPGRARAIVQRILRERSISVLAGKPVTAVSGSGLTLAGGQEVAADAVIWATGAAAPAWLSSTGLALDARGFIAVWRTLQSISHPEVFAAGDCATLVDDPNPKSGVFAVRQGAVLAANLRHALAGQALAPFSSFSLALSLLNCGDRHAVASWDGIALEGRWAWRWKDWIDRRYVARYPVPAHPGPAG